MGQKVKNLLRGQSKYGLMGSSGKTGKFYFRGSQEHFLHKSAIWDRTPPPHLHIKCSLHVCRRVQGSQIFKTEFNYLDSFESYGRFSDFMVPIVLASSLSSPHHPHRPHIIPIALRRSHVVPMVCGLCGLCGLHMLSPWSPHVPVVPTSSPGHPRVVPIVPTLSPSSP